jgi:Na+/H+-translocating membrane pyrophosphatase
MERFILNKLNVLKSKKSISFKSQIGLQIWKTWMMMMMMMMMDINGAWDNIRKNMKASTTQNLVYCELKYHKAWVAQSV